jgi:hypothetical protein
MHKSRSPDAPAYGIIARTGKSWFVALQTKKTETGCTISGNRSGYGDFPFSHYWGLPVIDFTGESLDRCFDGLKIIEKIRVQDDISLLPALIKAYRDAGFKVHINGYESPIIDATQDQRDQLNTRLSLRREK